MDTELEPEWQPKPAIDPNSPTIIRVLAFRVDEAVEALAKLARKANRYGNEETTFVVSDRYEEKTLYRDWDGSYRSKMVAYHDIILYGVSVRVGDFELLARIEHTEHGNVVNAVPVPYGETPKQIDHRFRSSESSCEHCNRERNRKDTFVVRNLATGAQQQVGRNCLKDHLGIDPSRAIAKFGFLVEAGNIASEHCDTSHLFVHDLEFILSAAATSIRLDGWVSGTTSRATEGRVPSTLRRIAVLWSYSKDKYTIEDAQRLRKSATDDDVALAKQVIEWVRSDKLGNSDYEHNLRVACADDTVYNAKNLGLIVSSIAAYMRAKEQAIKRAAELAKRQESNHIGEVGQRIKGLKVRLVFSRGLGENGFGGYSTLRKFVTEDGNYLAWITSVSDDNLVGERWLTIDATVKKHSEYNKVKETLLTRVKFISAE